MNFDIDVSDLRALGFKPERALMAAAIALTKTGVAVRTAQQAEMRDVFDRPKPYTLGAVYLKPATPQDLEARVGIKDDASEGRPPTAWLRWQIKGGLRTLTGWEKALVAAKAMDGGDRAVPAKYARLDAYGNISRGQLAQIFSQLRVETGRAGGVRTLPSLAFTDNKKERQRKLASVRRAYTKAGGQFVAFPYGRGRLKPGLYLADRFNRQELLPVLIFVSKAQYESGRLDFWYVAQSTIRRVLPAELTSASIARNLVVKGRS